MELPPKPFDTDCCGSGCTPCVFDVYEELLRKTSQPLIIDPTIRHDLLTPLRYKPFLLTNIAASTPTCNIYTFKPVENSAVSSTHGILPYTPGQHVFMLNIRTTFQNARENIVFSSTTVSRCYTLVSMAQKEQNCYLKFLIRLYNVGIMSSFISRLLPNDVVYLRGPFGDFQHLANSKYLIICAGTGFASMFPIINMILSDVKDDTLIRLCLACTTLDEIPYREEIRQFSLFWNFKGCICLSRELTKRLKDEVKFDEDIRNTRITFDVLKELIVDVQFKVLICGSDKFNKQMQMYAEKCGCTNIFVF